MGRERTEMEYVLQNEELKTQVLSSGNLCHVDSEEMMKWERETWVKFVDQRPSKNSISG